MTAKTADLLKNYLYLLAGIVLMIFSNFNLAIPAAAWLAPVFILRFMRSEKSFPGILAGGIAILAADYIMLSPMLKMIPLFISIFMIVSLSLANFLVYYIDWIFSKRLKGLLSTLAFPLFWTTKEFIQSFIPGSASIGSLAYSQYGSMALIQIVSVTGIWGLSFLIAWFAPVVNLAWENGFSMQKIKKTAVLFSTILILVLLYGGTRIVFSQPKSETIRLASVTEISRNEEFKNVYKYKNFISPEEAMKKLNDLTSIAASSGAKIIVWQEYGFLISHDEEAALLKDCSQAALKNKVYLSVTASVYQKDLSGRAQNKTYLFDPEGVMRWEYIKHYLLVGVESFRFTPGAAVIPYLQTPYGKLSSAICYDNDFPQYIQQAGRNRTDIFLIPSLDWDEITPFHSYMSVFRAVENGFSMFRAAGSGLSIAADYLGRVQAAKSDYKNGYSIMIADLPTKGVRTIYSYTGDLFAWLCAAGFIALTGVYFIRRKKA